MQTQTTTLAAAGRIFIARLLLSALGLTEFVPLPPDPPSIDYAGATEPSFPAE